MKHRLAAAVTAILLPLGAAAGLAATAAPASAEVIFGPQCSEVYDGHVVWINGVKYTCTKTKWGWWYIAYFNGCDAAPQTAPGRPATVC
jgi:hypothetical protein